jgi:hypothetical protein
MPFFTSLHEAGRTPGKYRLVKYPGLANSLQMQGYILTQKYYMPVIH